MSSRYCHDLRFIWDLLKTMPKIEEQIFKFILWISQWILNPKSKSAHRHERRLLVTRPNQYPPKKKKSYRNCLYFVFEAIVPRNKKKLVWQSEIIRRQRSNLENFQEITPRTAVGWFLISPEKHPHEEAC